MAGRICTRGHTAPPTKARTIFSSDDDASEEACDAERDDEDAEADEDVAIDAETNEQADTAELEAHDPLSRGATITMCERMVDSAATFSPLQIQRSDEHARAHTQRETVSAADRIELERQLSMAHLHLSNHRRTRRKRHAECSSPHRTCWRTARSIDRLWRAG